MNGRTIFGAFAILLSMIQVHGLPMSKGQPLDPAGAVDRAHQAEAVKEHLLDATVEIKMTFQQPAGEGEGKLVANGLGSLVWSMEAILLVTHNHWGEVLKDQTVIVFSDNDQRVIKIMLGREFQRLAIYRDAGTLVLRAPEELARLIDGPGLPSSSRTRLGDSSQVKEGDTVWLAYHQTGNGGKIGLLEARVEYTTAYKALPVFVLRSLNGDPIVQGDSGGGIWHDGKLVGNLWATLTRGAANNAATWTGLSISGLQPTDKSYGAILPERAVKSR